MEEKNTRDIERITGNTAGAIGHDVAAAVIGKGLEEILEKFNNTVEQRITATMKEAMEQYSPTKEAANTVGDLSITVAQLRNDMATLKNQFKMTSNKSRTAPINDANKEQLNPNKSAYTWEDRLEFDPGWSTRKRSWYNRTLKDKEPDRYKEERKVWLQRAL